MFSVECFLETHDHHDYSTPDLHSITVCEHLTISSVVLLYTRSWWSVNGNFVCAAFLTFVEFWFNTLTQNNQYAVKLGAVSI